MKSYKTLFPKLSILIASFYTSLFLYFQTVSESKILFCKNEEQRIDYMIFSWIYNSNILKLMFF